MCELANIPPVLHMGSCVDISRMMILASELSKDSGLNISQLPVVGCAPEWMSEKAVSIGNYVVATGIDTFLGVDPYVKGSSEICDLLTGEHGVKDWVEANYTVETDIEKLGDLMIERIEQKRCAGHLSMKLAITGKGGVGKTTLASTLARLYADEGRPVLAADVDPDANLGLALGMSQQEVDSIVPISKMRTLVEERTGANEANKFFKLNPYVSDIPEKYAHEVNGVKLLVMARSTPAAAAVGARSM